MLATAAIVEASRPRSRARSPEGRRRSGDDREGRRSAAARRTRSPRSGPTAAARPCRHAELPEAEVLAGMPIRSLDDMRPPGNGSCAWARASYSSRGATCDGPESIDVACTASGSFELRRPRIETRHTHGTGCTLSSAIAANLALGLADREAIERRATTSTARSGMRPALGGGHGPLNHFWRGYTDQRMPDSRFRRDRGSARRRIAVGRGRCRRARLRRRGDVRRSRARPQRRAAGAVARLRGVRAAGAETFAQIGAEAGENAGRGRGWRSITAPGASRSARPAS